MMYAFYQGANKLYPVSQEAVDEAVRYCQTKLPEEAIVAVYGGEVIPLTNVSADPVHFFNVAPAEYGALVAAKGKFPDAVIHSHSQGQATPSREDMISQKESNIPYGIVVFENGVLQDVFFFGRGVKIAPYTGRPFKFGVYDCYQLVSDWYERELGIHLTVMPRRDMYWEIAEEPDILEQYYIDAGFEEIDISEIRRGDVVMFKIFGLKRVNHVAIYNGDGRILHHLYGTSARVRLSGYDNLLLWRKHIVRVIRHKELSL